MKWKVDVLRIGYGRKEIEVEADSADEAKSKALDEAGNQEFSEHHSDYKADETIRSEE